MDDNGDRRGFRGANDGLQAILVGFAVPFFMLTAFLAAPSGLVFHCLFLKVLERFVNGDGHVVRLGDADQRPVARADADFGLVAMPFDRKDHLGVELVSENLADFSDASLDGLADGGSDVTVPAGVFHVHGHLLQLLIEDL